MLSLSGPPGPWLPRQCCPATLIARSAAQPVNPVCLSGGWTGLHRPFRGIVWRGPNRAFQVMHSTPQASLPGLFRPRFFAPRTAPFWGQKSPRPRPQPADGVVISEPFWDDRRGPKTHSRRTGRKLGQVRYARQGLVRVPESNTKYGGKRGITGVSAAPVMGASISESSEIRQGKKCCQPVERRLLPAVHRTSIYSRLPGLPGLRF